MDRIDEALASQSVDITLKAPIRAACKLAKANLNVYYSGTDKSELYRITMGTSVSSFFAAESVLTQ